MDDDFKPWTAEDRADLFDWARQEKEVDPEIQEPTIPIINGCAF